MKKTLMLIVLSFVVISACFSFQLNGEPTAMILSGGGARGAYQIGVWKALIDLDAEIAAAYGVSVGAINGAVIAADDYETARNLWLSISKADVLNISEAGKRVLSGKFSLNELIEAAGEIINNEGLDASPLRIILEKYIDEGRIRSGSRDFGLLTFSLSDFQTEYVYIADIPEGELVDYILASANFPLFQRQVIGQKEYIDGGVYKNIPIEMVDAEKTGQVIIVTLNFYTPFDIIDSLLQYEAYDLDIKIISPSHELPNILDFDVSNSEKLLTMGYLDGLRAFDAIWGEEYYLSSGEDVIMTMFLALNPQEIETACELLEVSCLPGSPDSIYEEIILPEICREVENSSGSGTLTQIDDYSISFLEIAAKKTGVNSLELYTPAGLSEAIVTKYIARDDFRRYYDRYIDFLSYLWLKSEYRLKFQMAPEGLRDEVLKSFNSGKE